MKIEEGKYYRTRDGRKVGPASAPDGMWGRFEIPGEWVSMHEPDGTYCGDDRSLDLIAEWTDGPVFVNLNGLHVRPEDVVGFWSRDSVTTFLLIRGGGHTWPVDMTIDEVAKCLNRT